MKLIAWWLRRVAGDDLTRDIQGDVAEARGGFVRLAMIAGAITIRRVREAGLAALGRRGRIASVAGDFRFAARSLRRSPWYATTTITVIALSMALATTVFAVVDGVLFKRLPYPKAAQLFVLQPWVAKLARPIEPMSASRADLVNWSQASGLPITGYVTENRTLIADASGAGSYRVASVQPNLFDVLGVHPILGGFSTGDFSSEPGKSPALAPALISHDVWQSRFGGKADVVGQVILDNAVARTGYRVVGVMPGDFLFPSLNSQVQLITPMLTDPRRLTDPSQRGIREVLVRLPANDTAAALSGRLLGGLAASASAFPPAAAGRVQREPYDRIDVVGLGQWMGRRERPLFASILAAALVLVMLGAVNVSGLLAARCLDRSRELALRRALGAGAAGIARLVAVEAFLLIGAGCLVGLCFAPSLLSFGLSMLPDGLSLLKAPDIDWRVVVFVMLAACALTAPASIWPIRRALRFGAGQVDSSSHVSERRRSVGRFVVVTSQVAGAAVLTVVGALLVGSLLTLSTQSINVRTDDVLEVRTLIMGPGGRSDSQSVRAARVGEVLARLRAMPGVMSAGAGGGQGLRSGPVKGWFNPPPDAPDPARGVVVVGVTGGFFRTVEPVLVSGRLPTDDELTRKEPLLVVGEGIARAYFSGASPVGRTLTLGEEALPFRIVGVVKDVRWLGMDVDLANIYGPYELLSKSVVAGFYVSVSVDAGAVKNTLAGVITAVDPGVQPSQAQSLGERFSESIRGRRLQAWLFGAFAASALTIVAVGVFGLTAMAMARRSKEVGIRMALGSTRSRLVSLLVREQLVAVALGLVVGCAAAAFFARSMSWFLFGLGAFDIRVWATAIVAIILASTGGTLLPSLRASRVDPVATLRID